MVARTARKRRAALRVSLLLAGSLTLIAAAWMRAVATSWLIAAAITIAWLVPCAVAGGALRGAPGRRGTDGRLGAWVLVPSMLVACSGAMIATTHASGVLGIGAPDGALVAGFTPIGGTIVAVSGVMVLDLLGAGRRIELLAPLIPTMVLGGLITTIELGGIGIGIEAIVLSVLLAASMMLAVIGLGNDAPAADNLVDAP